MKTRHSLLSAVAPALALALIASACGDDGGTDPNACPPGDPFCLTAIPEISLQPAATTIEFSDTGTRSIRVINTGVILPNKAPPVLNLKSVALSYDLPPGADDEGTPAFVLRPLPVELPAKIEVSGGTAFPQGLDIQIQYTKHTDSVPRTATLTLFSNDPLTPELVVTLTDNAGAPSLSVTPSPVDFHLVPKSDDRKYQALTLLNQGTKTLHVGGFRIAKDPRFGVRWDGLNEVFGVEGFEGISLEEAIEIGEGESLTIEVSFLSDSPSPADGQLLIFSDDPITGTPGLAVPLIANKSGPCITVNPKRVDFRGKLVGSVSTIDVTVESCGTEPLVINSMAFASGSSPDFELDFSKLPTGFEDGPSPSLPLTIGVGDEVTVGVVFVPDAVNPRDADNVPIPDEGIIAIASNAFLSKVEVPVAGAGADVECPTPVITVEEGEEVIPQTVIHLSGLQSYAPFGEIATWTWKIEDWAGPLSSTVGSEAWNSRDLKSRPH